MIISHDAKCIFFHIPKTAGTAIRRVLHPYNPKSCGKYYHTMYKDALGLIRGRYQKYFKFAFIRNPYDRTVSFHYFRKEDRFLRLHPHRKGQNLLDALYEGEGSGRGGFDINYFPCAEWLTLPGSDEIMMDYVGRHETIQEDWKEICKRIGIKHKMVPRVRRSSKRPRGKHYRDFYDDETRRIVEERFERDFKLFGYEW